MTTTNPWAVQFSANKQPSQMPEPDMKQASGLPQAAPSPFPSSGFAKQGMMAAQSKVPGLMGGDQ